MMQIFIRFRGQLVDWIMEEISIGLKNSHEDKPGKN